MKKLALTLILALVCAEAAFAGLPTAGSTLNQYAREKRSARDEERLKQPVNIAPRLDAKEITKLPSAMNAVFVTAVRFQISEAAAEAADEEELVGMAKDLEGMLVDVDDMKKLADDISAKYEGSGVRAYVPKQKFQDGVLYVNVVRER